MHYDPSYLLDIAALSNAETLERVRMDRTLHRLGITRGPRERSAGALRWLADRVEPQGQAEPSRRQPAA